MVAAVDAMMSEYERHIQELRGEAGAWKTREDANPRAAYFAAWLIFYMDELERSRQAHAETLNHWAQSIERTRHGA